MEKYFEQIKKYIIEELERCIKNHYEKETMVDFYTGSIFTLKEMLEEVIKAESNYKESQKKEETY